MTIGELYYQANLQFTIMFLVGLRASLDAEVPHFENNYDSSMFFHNKLYSVLIRLEHVCHTCVEQSLGALHEFMLTWWEHIST